MELTELLNTNTRQGPPTQFQPWHLLSAFYAFCVGTAPIGRYQLGSDLQLGGGSVRSLIRLLRERNLIEPVKRQGHQLSPNGKKHCAILSTTLIKLVELPESSFTIDVRNFGCHLRQLSHLVTDGVALRDAAIQAGASGATTFVQDQDPTTLVMVKAHRVQKSELKAILHPFNLEPGDVLVIATGSSRICAKLGAFAATFTLLKKRMAS